MKQGKKRILGPPPSFFTSNLDEDDETVDCDQIQNIISLPVSFPATNYKNDGLMIVENDIMGALAIWRRGIVVDPGNYLVHDLISQALLSLDELLPAIKSAEEVIRIAPGWADGYVTLARAQREFGEPELALENIKVAQSIFQRRSSQDSFHLEEYPVHPSDSTFEEIQFERVELEGIVNKLEQKRLEYQQKSEIDFTKARAAVSSQSQIEICSPCQIDNETATITDQQLRRCLHNLCGRVRVVTLLDNRNINTNTNSICNSDRLEGQADYEDGV